MYVCIIYASNCWAAIQFHASRSSTNFLKFLNVMDFQKKLPQKSVMLLEAPEFAPTNSCWMLLEHTVL